MPLPIVPQREPTHPCCKDSKVGCELTTLTATQIGAAVAFVFALGAAVFGVLSAGRTNEEYGMIVEFLIFVGISILYYFFGCWLVEVQYADALRSLNWMSRNVEFFLRIVILVWFAFFSALDKVIYQALQTRKIGGALPAADALALYLCSLFLLFLLWDVFVLGGICLLNRNLKPHLTIPITERDKTENVVTHKHRDARTEMIWVVVADGGGLCTTVVIALLLTYNHPGVAAAPLILGIFVGAILIWTKIVPGITPQPVGDAEGIRSRLR
jgi:hypothetical protein